jgi:hypothetical protein
MLRSSRRSSGVSSHGRFRKGVGNEGIHRLALRSRPSPTSRFTFHLNCPHCRRFLLRFQRNAIATPKRRRRWRVQMRDGHASPVPKRLPILSISMTLSPALEGCAIVSQRLVKTDRLWSVLLMRPILLAGRAHPGLPSRSCIRCDSINFGAIALANWVVESSTGLVCRARWEALIVASAPIHSQIDLPVGLTIGLS